MLRFNPTLGRIVIILICWFAQPCNAQIFKWVDEKGKVHFGDEPPDQLKSERLTPDTSPLGVQLINPNQAESWKQDAISDPAQQQATFQARTNQISK